MTFQDYLAKSLSIAQEEKEVLDFLSDKEFDKINIRAAKSSLQVLVENCIGKAKKYFRTITAQSFQTRVVMPSKFYMTVKL